MVENQSFVQLHYITLHYAPIGVTKQQQLYAIIESVYIAKGDLLYKLSLGATQTAQTVASWDLLGAVGWSTEVGPLRFLSYENRVKVRELLQWMQKLIFGQQMFDVGCSTYARKRTVYNFLIVGVHVTPILYLYEFQRTFEPHVHAEHGISMIASMIASMQHKMWNTFLLRIFTRLPVQVRCVMSNPGKTFNKKY